MAHRLIKAIMSFLAVTAFAITGVPVLTTAAELPAVQDPTRPVHFVAPKAAQAQTRQLQLQAIVIGSDRAETVINGRRLRRGDVINEATILAIYPGRVVYERDGEKSELLLRPRVIRPLVAEE